MSTPVFRMKPGGFIDRFLVGADRPLEAGANAWVKETVGRRETMVQNAYATGLKVWVPNDEMEPSPKRYFYGTGHGRSIKTGRLTTNGGCTCRRLRATRRTPTTRAPHFSWHDHGARSSYGASVGTRK